MGRIRSLPPHIYIYTYIYIYEKNVPQPPVDSLSSRRRDRSWSQRYHGGSISVWTTTMITVFFVRTAIMVVVLIRRTFLGLQPGSQCQLRKSLSQRLRYRYKYLSVCVCVCFNKGRNNKQIIKNKPNTKVGMVNKETLLCSI